MFINRLLVIRKAAVLLRKSIRKAAVLLRKSIRKAAVLQQGSMAVRGILLAPYFFYILRSMDPISTYIHIEVGDSKIFPAMSTNLLKDNFRFGHEAITRSFQSGVKLISLSRPHRRNVRFLSGKPLSSESFLFTSSVLNFLIV